MIRELFIFALGAVIGAMYVARPEEKSQEQIESELRKITREVSRGK